MPTTVTLGLVTLQAFEIPATIAFGGRQRLAVHDLPGGGRVIDVLGGADNDIVFSGIISGDGADTRAQLLDALRITGTSLPLSWGEQYFIVIIAAADFDYRKPWWIPYRLRCVVQSNLVYGAAATVASAAVSIAADLASATSLLPDTPASLSAAQTAVTQTGAMTYSTAAYGQSISARSALTGLSRRWQVRAPALPALISALRRGSDRRGHCDDEHDRGCRLARRARRRPSLCRPRLLQPADLGS